MSAGEELKRLRANRTQRDVAEETRKFALEQSNSKYEMSQQVLTGLETNRTSFPTVQHAIALAHVYGVTLGEILGFYGLTAFAEANPGDYSDVIASLNSLSPSEREFTLEAINRLIRGSK